ncbi:MAG: flagellar hook capping protein [Rhodocyclales bacterium]|nr:flagellar hook capping protein [Rhodocyclales bacterium]
MAVDLIGGGASAAQQSLDLQQSSLGQEQFLRVLLAQLKFQDPLKPMDNQQFLAQMAQFSELAQTSQLNNRIDSLLSIQSATQSIGLIGKTVEVRLPSGSRVGTVASLTFSNGQPSLTVNAGAGELLTGVSLSEISVVR